MLKYSISGDTATLQAGQSCTNKGVTFNYTSGSSTLNGSMTTETYAFAFTGGGASGTGTAGVTCTKQ
jgi:hypothetical protein